MSDEEVIDVADLTIPAGGGATRTADPVVDASTDLQGRWNNLVELEEGIVAEALNRTGGNVAAAARMLGVGRSVILGRVGRIAKDTSDFD